MVDLLAGMRERGDAVADKASFEYFVVSSRFDVLCFIDGHADWARDCHLEMQTRTNLWLIRMLSVA